MLKSAIATALTLLTTSAFATDLQGIKDATFQLWSGTGQICSMQVVKSDNDGTLLLTAFHCIDPDKKNYSLYDVKYNDKGEVISEKKYMADVKRKNKLKDVAVLELRDKSVRFHTVDVATNEESKEALKLGTPVIAAGYPGSSYDTQFTMTEGIYNEKVNSLVGGLDYPFHRVTSVVAPGSSGGGLYVQTRPYFDEWKLVGVASQRDPTLPGVANLFTTTESINSILKGLTETPRETLKNK